MSRPRIDWQLALLLAAALGLRLLAWLIIPYRDFISDEAEYWGAAVWLGQGRGFAFFDQWVWTRPPAYLLFLAGHIKLFGPSALWAPRLSQALLGTLSVWLLTKIGARLAPAGLERRVGLLAGWALAVGYSFAIFSYVLLSETFFLTLFLAAVLFLLRWANPAGRRRDLAAAALLLGLCALTRAVVLTWLPFAAFWALSVERRRRQSWRAALAAVALLTALVCALVLPWSAYATLRWGQGDGLILSDTTGGYNFALGAQSGLPGGRDEGALYRLLCDPSCGPDHAARQAKAYALGWAWIREAPGGFARKTGRELLDMLLLRTGGAERFQAGYTNGDVPLPHALLLLLDDTLYLAAIGLAALGLARSQGGSHQSSVISHQSPPPGKGLALSWLGYNVLIGALIFAISRFRQPLLPFVYVYAACGLVQWGQAWPSRRRRLGGGLAAGALALAVLPSYVWPPALAGDRRSVVYDTWLSVRSRLASGGCADVGRALAAGDIALARRLHDEADARQDLKRLALLYARILQREGKVDGPDGALAFLRNATSRSSELQAARIRMLEGDIMRAEGVANAYEPFVSRVVDDINDLDWAWDNLEPPPATAIDVGAGLDFGYIRGFYKRDGRIEQPDNVRWSGAVAQLRFPGAGTGRPQKLVLRLQGYTTNPQPTAMTVESGGRALAPVTLANDWQELTFELPAAPAGAEVLVTLRSDVCVLGPLDLAARVKTSNRQTLPLAGFQLDWARLE